MFHIYDGKNRVTDNPISYNYLFRFFYDAKSLIDWRKISELPEGIPYKYKEFTIVRAA